MSGEARRGGWFLISSAIALFHASPVLASSVAWAAPPPEGRVERLALVVGANQGVGADAPLRYAVSDATRFAAVLRELGRHAAGNVRVLREPSPRKVLSALSAMARKVAALRATGREVVFTFYYSGHAGPSELRLTGSVLPQAELRRRLRRISADVRIVIVDACHSGAFAALARKGGKPAPPFRIRLVDELAAKGEVFIASSAPHEEAQESATLQGSFFTSHLVSGLRGAADQNGDARVTLAEAYQYAYAQTVRSTALSHAGLQHPGYQYDVRGKRDLVLAWPGGAESHLTLRARSSGPFLVFSAGGQTLYAEVPAEPGEAPRIALPAGDYLVQKRTAAGLLSSGVALVRGQGGLVDEAAMGVSAYEVTVGRGGGSEAKLRGGTVSFADLGLELRLQPLLTPGFGGGYLDTARAFGFNASSSVAVEAGVLLDRWRWAGVSLAFAYQSANATRRPTEQLETSSLRVLLDGRVNLVAAPRFRLATTLGVGAWRARTSLGGVDAGGWVGGVRGGLSATVYLWSGLGFTFGYAYAFVNSLVHDNLGRAFSLGGHEVQLFGLSLRL